GSASGVAPDRRRGGARAANQRAGPISADGSAPARACRPHHRAPATSAIVPTVAAKTSRPPGSAARAHALGIRSRASDRALGRTPSGGVHVILPAGASSREVIPLAPEALQTLYRGWQLQRGGRSKRSGFVAIKPPRQLDTAQPAVNVSE